MKRVGIMLTAMIILGGVGGVLAFKVKRCVKYCTRATVAGVCPANATCPNGFDGCINNVPFVPTVCYTTTANTARCDDDTPACTATAKIDPEPPGD